MRRVTASETMRGGSELAAPPRRDSRRVLGHTDAAELYEDSRERESRERCWHCDQPVSLVGALTLVITRHRFGVSSARLCRECSAIATETSEPTASLPQTLQAIDASLECPTCHKPRGIANVNAVRHRARIVLEPMSAETHCTCAGGPAAHLVATGGAQ